MRVLSFCKVQQDSCKTICEDSISVKCNRTLVRSVSTFWVFTETHFRGSIRGTGRLGLCLVKQEFWEGGDRRDDEQVQVFGTGLRDVIGIEVSSWGSSGVPRLRW